MPGFFQMTGTLPPFLASVVGEGTPERSYFHALMDPMLLCPGNGLALPNSDIDSIATRARFLLLSLPNNEMLTKSQFAINKTLIEIRVTLSSESQPPIHLTDTASTICNSLSISAAPSSSIVSMITHLPACPVLEITTTTSNTIPAKSQDAKQTSKPGIITSRSLSSLLNYSRGFGDGPVAGVAKWSRYRIMVGMLRVRAQCYERPTV
ncbi:hypothetical protein TNCV_4902491 [Trichonephila clavipes]|nr:hypothetical protein TNCV_4902491 [Trichonephila clavipes]